MVERAQENKMWQHLDRPLAIFLLVALPLAWGMGVEYVFHLLRSRSNAGPKEENDIV